MFDATFPSLNNGRMSPIIIELDKETFDNLVYPLNDDKERLETKVYVEHFDPLKVQFINVTYNSSIEKVKVKERINGEHERLQ